jgi:hypothetical protein
MTDIREAAAKAAREHDPPCHLMYPEQCFEAGYLLGHAAGVADGARDVAQQAHDAMERALGRLLKAAQVATSERFKGQMRAASDWIASLQEELFINPETRILSSRPAPGTGIAENETNSPEWDKE